MHAEPTSVCLSGCLSLDISESTREFQGSWLSSAAAFLSSRVPVGWFQTLCKL